MSILLSKNMFVFDNQVNRFDIDNIKVQIYNHIEIVKNNLIK